MGIYASVICGALTIMCIPVFIWLILKKNNESDFKDKYGTLTDELSPKSNYSKLWNVFMLIRWTLTVVILLVLSEFPSIQILILLLMSIWY